MRCGKDAEIGSKPQVWGSWRAYEYSTSRCCCSRSSSTVRSVPASGWPSRITHKWPGAKKFFVIGFLALMGFGWQLSSLNGNASLWTDILPALAANGMFLMLVMATTAMQTFRDVQYNEAVLSNAQQLKNMVAQFGMALGIAVATIALQWRTTEHYGVLNSRFNASDASYIHLTQQLSDSLAASSGSQQVLSLAVAQLARQLGQQATLMACLDYFSAIAWIGVAGAVAMAIQRLMK